MIDFTKVKFDEDRRPYIVERGAKGKFERKYLNDAEQQAHKEWDCERVSRLNSQALAPANDQNRAEARNSTLRSGYSLPDGPTGAVGPGPCPVGEEPLIPYSIESGIDANEVPPGQRVARRAVSLMDSIHHLTVALYDFGAIDNSCAADLRARVMDIDAGEMDDDNSDQMVLAEGDLIPAYNYVRSLAYDMHTAYHQSRTQAPLKVVGYHAAPIITLAQFLMGQIFPDGDMARRAQTNQLLYRADSSVSDLAGDILTVYNNIQADISEAGRVLLGQSPEEIGGINVGLSELALIDTVLAVDEMLEYLSTRMDQLTEMLRANL